MVPKSLTFRRRVAEAVSDVLDTFARLPGRRFYDLHLEAAARRHRRELNAIEIAADKECIKFRTPSGKSLWRAETLFSKEPITIAWIDAFHKDDVFWDIGANVGVYSLYAAKVKGVLTLAFEPASFNHALLCDNIHLNALSGRISAYELAFSDRSQLGKLRLEDDEPGVALATIEQDGAGRLEQSILVFSIDDFVDRFSPPFPTHIKIDVDGVEQQILKGATNTLSDARLRSLIVEVDEHDAEQPNRVDSFLEAHRFRLVEAEGSPLAPDYPSRNRLYQRT